MIGTEIQELYNMDGTATILAQDLKFPEGPAFDPDGNLWCVELQGGSLVRWTQESGIERFEVSGAPNGLTFDASGNAWFCDAEQNAIRCFDPLTSTCQDIVESIEGEQLHKPNDLAFDRAGNLLFTCPGDSRREPTGYICCFTPQGECFKIAEKLYFPNGLAFSQGGSRLILAETYRHRLWIGHWDTHSLCWQHARVLAEVGGPIGPDGMAIGDDGKIYVAVYGSGMIKVVNEQGTIETHIALPGQNPTNVAFDPAEQLGLVVTEAAKGLLVSFPDLGPGIPLFKGPV